MSAQLAISSTVNGRRKFFNVSETFSKFLKSLTFDIQVYTQLNSSGVCPPSQSVDELRNSLRIKTKEDSGDLFSSTKNSIKKRLKSKKVSKNKDGFDRFTVW